ncbi:MAG TPA: flagellar biosynthetic protein FliO, partial [Burkholderiaceae bacterium]|nr:flagellar biosynthetic protein FliO [Burkholderiaceae bacterium]
TSTPAAPVDGPSFVPMVLALILVLGLLAAAIWVLRRAGFAPRGGSSQLRLVTQLALGPRERVVIVEAGERWWLLGVGASGVTRLGSLPKGDAGASAMPAASFGALLEKLRAGQR